MPGVVMPGFAQALSDADIARIAAYLRRTRTNLPPWPDLDAKIAAMRQADRRRAMTSNVRRSSSMTTFRINGRRR